MSDDLVNWLRGLVECQVGDVPVLIHKAADELEALRAENERLRAALTPSAETKADYMGEFSVPFPHIDENGDEVMSRVNVPWTIIKEIMAAIRIRAALNEKAPDAK